MLMYTCVDEDVCNLHSQGCARSFMEILERLDLEYLRTHYREVEIPNASNRMIHGCTISSAMTKDGCIVCKRGKWKSLCFFSFSFSFFFLSSDVPVAFLMTPSVHLRANPDTPSSSHSPIVAAPYNAVLYTQLPVLPTTHLHHGTAAGLDSCRLFPIY
jgi:hypothetical protein